MANNDIFCDDEITGTENILEDPRLDNISRHILLCLGITQEKWQIMIENEEFKCTVLNWLNIPERRLLIFTINATGFLITKHSLTDLRRSSLTMATTISGISNTMLPLPGSSFCALDGVPRGKATYFLKKEAFVVTLHNFHNAILFGDVPLHSQVESLEILFDQICIPLLSNTDNRKLWSNIVSQDLDMKMKEMRNRIEDIKSKTNNKTVLAILLSPDAILDVERNLQKGDSSACDEHFQNKLEEMVINWTTQIHKILNVREPCIINMNSSEYMLPLNEVSFWNTRKFHLQDVYEQIKSPTIVAVASILERIGSNVYSETFHKIFKELIMALHEAQDISLWLNPIIRQTAAFSSVNFINSMDLIEPLVHVVHLIWKNSRYYCSSKRMTILLKAICNLLMHRASEDLELPMLFQADTEADDGLTKIVRTMSVLDHFKSKVQQYKACYARNQTNESCELWKFSSYSVFKQLNGFLEQLSSLQNVFQLASFFQSLEKIEIGGMRGKLIKEQIMDIHLDFKRVLIIWSAKEIDFNNKNIDCKILQRKLEDFFRRTDVLEKRLSTVLIKSFADSYTTEHILKVVILFRDFLNRNVMQNEVKAALPDIINIFRKDLEEINISCLNTNGNHTLGFKINSSRMTTELIGLNQKMQRMEILRNPVFENALHLESNTDYQIIKEKQNVIINDLKRKKLEIFHHWLESLNEKLSQSFNEFIFYWQIDNSKSTVPDTTHAIKHQLVANVSVHLFTIIREIKYLRTSQTELDNLPTNALELFNCRDEMWERRNILIKIEELYNQIYKNVLPCEYNLICGELLSINDHVNVACSTVQWGRYDSNLVLNIMEKISSLHHRFQCIHANFENIIHSIKNCCCKLPIQRCPFGRNYLDLQLQKERLINRLKCCEESNVLIRNLITDNFCRFKNDEHFEIQQHLDDQKYLNYLKYINNLINVEIYKSVKESLESLIYEFNKIPNTPLFEVKLELMENEIIFIPSLESTSDTSTNIAQIINDLINNIFYAASKVPTLSEETIDFWQNEEVQDLVSQIHINTSKTFKDAKLYAEKFKRLEFLWTESMASVMKNLKVEYSSTSNRSVIVEALKKQIDRYNDLYEDIENLDNYQVINHWLIIDIKPLKHALLNKASKWADSFKQWLLEYVIDTLRHMETFIETGLEILNLNITNDDFGAFLKVLSIMSQIKERESMTNNIFKPLKEVITLLKFYNTEFDQALLKNIDQLPNKWKILKETAIAKIDSLVETKDYQQNIIRSVIVLFDYQLRKFLLSFQTIEFFSVPCYDVYYLCDIMYKRLNSFKQSRKRIFYCARLLEISTSDDSQMLLCQAELKRVKQLWDFVHVIQSCIIDWKSTPWYQIDTDDVENECKKFARELRTLDKSVRMWKPYEYIASAMKDLVSSLRIITELQNPAITERHWMELMCYTKMQLQSDKSTTLNDLLELGLHRFDEEVKSTVDKAIKEITVTKAIDEIRNTWTQMEFDKELHIPRQIQLIRVSEELIETLDDNQMQLQNISTSKHIDYLLPQLHHWQKILSDVDVLITHWLDVQRKWIYLESIFIGSEDIRKQLPEDAALFEEIDFEFTRMLKEAETIKVVIDVAENRDIHYALARLENKLSICEKALSEYLETKRLIFPRFYFISAMDLLDILSNGNNPRIVCRHLIKLFDSIKQLKFLNDMSNSAVGMHSKENDEYVYFLGLLVNCTGRVEIWLNDVIKQMKVTLHTLFKNALIDVRHKPKEDWLKSWPAQTALCCSQIAWTTSVNHAFTWIEEGYEGAMKELQKHQISQLNVLINLLLSELDAGDRQKIMTICTIDVHNRDVVLKIIQQKVENALAFQWQSQLRHRWDNSVDNCYANICDAQFLYDFEYLGNTSRLVITPLTDRCYITLTQSLHLVMGGAPAGPAGTGKTETTKDLGRALGVMVYVFNCSEQMDYKSCGNIYKGLSQTGAWGCFDEFNRISVEVLSVVAVQVKSIQEAIKMKKTKFTFMGESISLVSSVGIFITMNPGYAGRTELPENLKMLFRPCAMIVPDFALICEIMLVAEGFQDARLLARKFITLYTLCGELLSKQDHYDWGLRAIKSVLVVAGGLKREDHSRAEDQVLMRALRDFNIPKIVTDDVSIFMGLIGDLFPAIEVPRKRFYEFEKSIRKAVHQLRLQPQESFLIKVVQLQELLNVRHSVFIVGDAGTGKTKIWQTLSKTYCIQTLKPVVNILNPKAMSSDELFGFVNSTTREWKDGLFSSIMRDQANMKCDEQNAPKWIVLDGDIDPVWIESLNTLMDDNKILTLASNERIVLTKNMRLIFEVGHLKAATPATVSRAGVLYINPQDLGWLPYVSSWLENRPDIVERGLLTRFFEKYFPSMVNRSQEFRKITPISDMAMIQMTCHLIDSILDNNQRIEADSMETTLEIIFAFAAVWGFGSALCKDHIIDWQREFHKWWTSEFKDVKFPSNGTVFDYFPDILNQNFHTWESKIQNLQLETNNSFENIRVPTADTVRLEYFLNLLNKHHLPILLVGTSGCGKDTVFKHFFCTSEMTIQTIHFNFYTTSDMFQKILDKQLEKTSGKCYAPSGNKRLIYYINDLNMPEVDTYGTVQPHTIIRQFMDYGQWYDRSRLILKNIRNCQFVATMNPTAGSFTVDPRLQRHFCAFSVLSPNESTLNRIYSSILNNHLNNPVNVFSKEIKTISSVLVSVSVYLQKRLESSFLPTALKFHYIFNLQDMTNIYQGLMNCTGLTCTKPEELIRIYVHEAFRVYHDRLIDNHDIKAFDVIIKDILKKNFEDFDEDYVFSEPLIYCHFAQSLVDQKYMPIQNWETLYQLLSDAQNNYNELVGHMNLVMFADAMLHVCRINRILENSGNVLLIGVGGSGKQTLARLASFISSFSVFQMEVKRGYSQQDMREDIANLYIKVGLKNVMSVFLLTDAQIPNESVLIICNDMLASGDVPLLFNEEQIEMIFNGIRNEVKQTDQLDTKDNCWLFFINKIRRMLKIVLCFSPVGPTLRIRARKFRTIISKTCIDWFHEWPNTALQSVSKTFLNELTDILPEIIINPIGNFMAYVHESVNRLSKLYLENEKRYNYTTPKTYFEYIFLYKKLITDKCNEYCSRIERLESGMAKLTECAHQVDTLKNQLAQQEVQLHLKNLEADKLIVIITAENEEVQKEKLIASDEEKKVRIIEEDVSIKTQVLEDDLRKAEPALVAAQAALNTLNKNNLTELKSFGSPPKAVVNVCAAVMVLLAVNGKIPRDRSWKSAKLMMVRVDQFLNELLNYDKDNIHPNIIEVLQEYLSDPEFNPDKIVQKSVAAAGLCAWVINIHRYHEVFLIVGPKHKALLGSQEELRSARERLKYLKSKISGLEGKLHEIKLEFEEATAQKQKSQNEADKTAFTINLAHRLINGLANENVRWRQSILSLKGKLEALPGDILLVSSFLSYVGSFTKRYRIELHEKIWMPYFKKTVPKIPYSKDGDSFISLHDEARIATWHSQGLPMDQMSTENATILTYSNRWPLLIDPQLQGIKWIRKSYGSKLVSIHLDQKGYVEILEKSISMGETVIIENIEETIDTVLDPLLNRALIKRGRYIKIGNKEIEFNPHFRLILQTKLANPHYKPELQAQMTLINFTVTQDGLEEQLLAEVVKMERPDLEDMRIKVTIQQNKFKIALKELEDELLARLTSSGKNVLDNHALVINLETTKNTVAEIERKVFESNETTVQIDVIRNIYRHAAKRASILFFVLSDLNIINPMYKFSLKSFMVVFRRAIAQTSVSAESLEKRVTLLVESITYQSFRYAIRGLFETDKLIFTFHMIIQILLHTKSITKEEIEFLLRYPHDPNVISPIDFINHSTWSGIKHLSSMEHFYGIDKDIENYPKRWKKFLHVNFPEKEVFPGEWKHRTTLQKLCIIRTLRPDRLTYSIRHFVEKTMGENYSDVELIAFSETYRETSPTTPVLFILSPGVDPVHNVEQLGIELKFTTERGNLYNISLGQGQELVAEKVIETALKEGKWVVLQNIHLVENWLPKLEHIIENIDEGVHSDFRLFITAEPALDSQYHIIPQGILESSIKIVNEPPTGMAPNLHKAWNNFNQDFLEKCTQEAEFKSILFTLCFFHAIVGERRKFGPLGWNKVYPFNIGDLNISAYVLYNYLEGSNRIPWEDLRYIFGEIMYGGHITDDWDRRLCQTHLEELLRQELIDNEFELCPGFPAPPNMDFNGYHNYISEMLPDESPVLYGLHPNAEISFLTTAGENLLRTVFELQPRESDLNSNFEPPREELVKISIDEFLDKLQDEFNIYSLLNRIEKKTPFVVVALQECERMNALITEIKRSLRELLRGIKGELTITPDMERLHNAIFYNNVPYKWTRLAYPSMMSLHDWLANLIHRIKELTVWLNDFKLPCVIWLGGLFNPQSFLTAIMQEAARKHDFPLDRMCLSCDVTKKEKEDINLPPLEGAFVHSLYLDGASWDCNSKIIVPLRLREVLCTMPVIYIKSIVQEKQDVFRRVYECPLYKTRLRGATYVWSFNLYTNEQPSKWILAGVALLLQP